MTQQTFDVAVKHDVIAFTTIEEQDLTAALNKWSVDQAKKMAGPGVVLSNVLEIAINKETGLWRVSGKEVGGDDVWFWMPAGTIVGDYEVLCQKDYYRAVPLFSIAECVANVVGWSTARGILENGVWYTQGTKLYEEDGEAATGVGKNKHPLIMDGIGDALVVLVNLMELTGYDSSVIDAHVSAAREDGHEPGNAHYLFHKMRFHITNAVDYLWDYAGVDAPKKLNFDQFDNDIAINLEYHYQQMVAFANSLAQAYGMTLEQCFSLAWDEIKDRKGFLNADGIFIKEADA